MKKYRTSSYSIEIAAYEVIKETAANVTYLRADWRADRGTESTERKVSAHHRWFGTWDEAKAWLAEEAERKVQSARRALQQAQDRLGNVKGMRQPEEPV